MVRMTSNKPYLIRAFYDWIVDNELTPYILVDADYPSIQVPTEYINEGRIVLNISPAATRGLVIGNDRIVFTARFSGKTEQIFLSPRAVLEIYAQENGEGGAFAKEEAVEAPLENTTVPTASKKPSLKLVEK